MNFLQYSLVVGVCLFAFAATSLHGQETHPIGKHYADRIVLMPPNPEDSQYPAAAEVFDINGDGKDDISFSAWGAESFLEPAPLVIWTASENGGMELSTDDLVVGGIPIVEMGYRQIIPSDFNGDGHIDLFLETHGPEPDCGDGSGSCRPGGQNSLLLSDGNGQLQNVTATHLPQLMDFSHGSTVADFDGDGDVDIWVNNIGNSPLQDVDFCYLLFNDGEGKFTIVADNSPEWYDNRIIGPNGILPDIVWIAGQWAMAVDSEGDGDTELAIPSNVLLEPDWMSNNLLFRNNGSGHFSVVIEDAWPPSPRYNQLGITQDALVYDFNNDHLDDLLLYKTTQEFTEPFAQVLISNGDGTFRDETQIRLPPKDEDIRAFQLHDLDQDGFKDFFVWTGNFGSSDGYADIRINDGEGFFRELEQDWVSGIGDNWRVLDVDGDGGTDWFAHAGGQNGYTLSKMILPYGPVLDGTDQAESLIGGALNNVFRGMLGDDLLDGGLGNDWLNGGPGNDVLVGSKGHDGYLWFADELSGNDTINDKQGIDRIRFKGFGLERVSMASKTGASGLLINFIDGGSLLIEHHFSDPGYHMELLKTDDCVYRISNNPAFVSGDISDLLGDCITHLNGFEEGTPPEPLFEDPCDIGAGIWAPEARNCQVEDCSQDGRYHSWDGKTWCRALITQEGAGWTVAVPPGKNNFDFWADWGAWDYNDCGDGIANISIGVCSLSQELSRDGEEQHLTCDVTGETSVTILQQAGLCDYVIIGDPFFTD